MKLFYFCTTLCNNKFFSGKIFAKSLTHNLKTRICPSYLSTLPKSQLDVAQDEQFLPDGEFSILVLHLELVLLNVGHCYFRDQI